MEFSFVSLLNASISASWLVGVVILARLVLKKAPKAIHCALWALVAIRLLCPVSIESQFSLVPSTQTVSDYYQTQQAASSDQQTVLDIVENPVYPEDVDISLEIPAHRMEWSIFEWNIIWPAGMIAMAGYALFSWLRLRRKVAVSIPIARDIRICDYIESPFILGIFRPMIYLPSDMDQSAVNHVLAHERAHLARRDHWWKPLGFTLLTIHWFNPILWLAYILLCRDIELACDEKVIRDLGADQKKAYSAALLQCSVSRSMIAACPLAFGEVGVKERVKNVLNYRKPAFWFVVLAVILCCVVAVCFLTDPLSPDVYDVMYQEGYTVLAQCDQELDITIPMNVIKEEAFSSEGQSFDENEVVLYRTDTTSLWLMNIQYANEGDDLMYFDFGVSHDLPKIGTILTTSRVKVGTHISSSGFRLTSRTVSDQAQQYEDSVSIRAHGPGQRFTVYIDTNVARNAKEFMTFSAKLNQLTYARNGAEPEIPKVIHAYDTNYKTWSFYSDEFHEFDVGINADDRIAFYDPYAAFSKMTELYADAILYLRDTYDLAPLTPLNYADYKKLGTQAVAAPDVLRADCLALAEFLDIYENSFSVAEDPAISASEYSGTLKAGNIVAQSTQLSSGYGAADCIFTLDHGTLFVSDINGDLLFQSNSHRIRTCSRAELFSSMAGSFAVYQGKRIVPMTEDFIPAYEDGDMEICEFYYSSGAEDPSYVIFFFNGTPTWFVEGNYLRFYEITPAMSENTESVTTYVSQEKIYWAWHSSQYVEGITMKVRDNAVIIENEGTFLLENRWQEECPISQEQRLILAELADIEPAFAFDDQRICRYLVLDETHFLVKYGDELYVVNWRNSNISLEIIYYIFHMVPEGSKFPEDFEPTGEVVCAMTDMSLGVDLGDIRFEGQDTDAAIRQYILANHPEFPADGTFACASFICFGRGITYEDGIEYTKLYLSARIGRYRENPDGTLKEEAFELLPVQLYLTPNWDGSYNLAKYAPDENEPHLILELEADCWNQAFAHFGTDTDTLVNRLKEVYPDYFRKSSANGLEVYWWNTPSGVQCIIHDKLFRQRTEAELKYQPVLTVPETMLILSTYDSAEIYYRSRTITDETT